VAPFSVVKCEVVSFFVVKWPPNLMSIVRLRGNSGPKFDEKLVPNIIDKHNWYVQAAVYQDKRYEKPRGKRKKE
jgi:hypothetical protein